ncbi:MAG: TlpA disulfide reductase family protein [Ottowia sp.]|nr:TlpA family protein disulfide reductase [Ottowia sp.]
MAARYAPQAPELQVSQWFNASEPIALGDLRGKVVMLYAFQMLCPACVKVATPQAQEADRRFAGEDLAVIGLHTVFEHHAAQQPSVLAAYIHENRLRFPIGVDEPGGDKSSIPKTMRRYALEGTPSTVLIDRAGRIRLRELGAMPDLALGVALGRLLAEPTPDGDG